MKKITQSFLTLLLLMVAGVAYGQKPTEVADLSADMYHRWVGVEADAAIADPDAPDGGVKLNAETDCPYGNTGVIGQDFADLTAWDYLTLVVTSDNPRLFFNDSSVGGGRLTVATANASDPYVENKGDGVYVINLAAIKEARAFVHLNAIKASAYNTKANVAEMKLAKGAPYIPVKVEVADLSKDMYHRWVGVEADATIADPDAPDGDVKLNTETDCPYGNTGVVGQDFADLTAWDYLTLVVTSDNPRLFFNDSSVGGGRLTVATANASDPYVENKGDGVYVINLAAIKEARAFVHLNAIKASSWNTKAVVEEMKLATGEAYLPAAKYDITVAAGIENGTVAVKDGLKKAAEGAKVTLTITPAEGYELDALSVLAGETAVQVADDNTFTMPAAAVTVTATFKEKQGGEEQGTEAKVADLAIDMFHKWTGFDAEATVADPDENGGAINLDAETDCPYGNTNVTEFEYADLSAWDYLTVVLNTDDQPRLFLNSKGGNDRIQVNTNDANYVVSNKDGVIVYNLAAIKEAAGFVHLNSIKASAYNTKANVAEMKLATVKPYIPVKAEVADLAADMFHKWTGFDAEATVADPDENGGAVNLNVETDCPYGNTNVTEFEYADLSAWDYLTVVLNTADQPRLFLNSKGGSDRIQVNTNDANYVVSNENGVIVYNLAAIKAAAGFVHLNSIKASAYNTKANVAEMKLATVEPYIPVVAETYAITIAEAENGSVTADVTEAAEGAKVTLTITPAEGYELDALSVAAGETPVEVADDNTFTMPAAAVTVTATFKEKQGGEEQGTEAKVADLAIDMFHKWTGFDAEATVADPDENGGAINLDAETDCPYGNTNVTEFEYADLSAWDYLTVVLNTDDQPRLFLNSKGGSDRIQVNTNDANYVVSNENGVIVYNLAAIKAAAGFVHLNSIKASAYNTKANVAEMKLATVEPYIPVVAETYAITIAEAENGSVTADVTEAAEGAKVTLTITPAEGYELDALSVAAGETAVEVAEDNTFIMPAAAVTVTATFKEKEGGDEPEPEGEEFVEMPELADGEFEKIPEDQGIGLDPFTRATTAQGEYEGVAYTTYSTTTDGAEVAIKMPNMDVTGCDYIVIYFAQPVKAGWSVAFWGIPDPSGLVDIPEGETSYKFEFANDPKGGAVVDNTIQEITLMTLGAENSDIKVYGIYKHKVGEVDAINGIVEDAVLKDGKYFINGQIVIVKDGKQYNANGVELK